MSTIQGFGKMHYCDDNHTDFLIRVLNNKILNFYEFDEICTQDYKIKLFVDKDISNKISIDNHLYKIINICSGILVLIKRLDNLNYVRTFLLTKVAFDYFKKYNFIPDYGAFDKLYTNQLISKQLPDEFMKNVIYIFLYNEHKDRDLLKSKIVLRDL